MALQSDDQQRIEMADGVWQDKVSSAQQCQMKMEMKMKKEKKKEKESEHWPA